MGLTKLRIEFDRIIRSYIMTSDLNNHLWNWVKEHSSKISNLVENRVSQPSEPSFGQWIDVNDRLPTETAGYLVQCEEGVCTAWYNTTYKEWEGDNFVEEGSGHPHYDNVIKWMPLPKP